MFRGKIKLRDLPLDIELEVEADTKGKIEDALEAAINVAMRAKSRYAAGVSEHMRSETYREPETSSELAKNLDEPRRITPLQASQTTVGGDITPQEPLVKNTGSRLHYLYKDAETIADYVEIALRDLGRLKGIRGYTNRDILHHMQETDGDELIHRNKRPTGAIGQAIRNSDKFVRDGSQNWLEEWRQEDLLDKSAKEIDTSNFFSFHKE